MALSSTEAEYMAVSDASKEALFLTKLHKELSKNNVTINLFTDSGGALKLTKGHGNTAMYAYVIFVSHGCLLVRFMYPLMEPFYNTFVLTLIKFSKFHVIFVRFVRPHLTETTGYGCPAVHRET